MKESEEESPAAEGAKAIEGVLRRAGLIAPGERPRLTPLTGGVSSDIWRADLADRSVCIKRALPRLKVAQVWEAPVERNRYEWEWMAFARALDPSLVPEPVARDAETDAFVMAWLAPDRHPVWKAELSDGRADPAFAGAVGNALARIHSASAAQPALRQRFDTTDFFRALRLDPYLTVTGERYPDLAGRLADIAEATAATRRALIHGDISPKNILAGPAGPVFLDAECAWWGDPAFDIAFCANHLLLKCLWRPPSTDAFLACFDALADRYLAGADWEDRTRLEARAARLLPALLLARIDGKSPVEYVTAEAERDLTRRVARPLILDPPTNLAAIRGAWAEAVGSHDFAIQIPESHA